MKGTEKQIKWAEDIHDYNGIMTISCADYDKAVQDIMDSRMTDEDKQAAIESLFVSNGAVDGFAARMDHMYDKDKEE